MWRTTVHALAVAALLLAASTHGAPCTVPLRVAQFVTLEAQTGIGPALGRFEAAHPNVSLALELHERHVMGNRVLQHAWIDSPSGVDVLPVESVVSDRLTTFADLSAVVDAFGPLDDMMDVAKAEMFDADGIPRVLPLLVDTTMWIYSRSLFSSLGLSPPSTYSELLAVCDVVRAAGKACIALPPRTLSPTVHFDYLAIRMYGNAFFDAFAAGHIAFSDPRVANVVSAFTRLIPHIGRTDAESRLPPPIRMPPPRFYDPMDMDTHDAALVLFASFAAESILNLPGLTQLTDADLAVFPFPAYDLPLAAAPPPDPSSVRGEIGTFVRFAIPPNARNVDGALDFLAFLASPAEYAATAADPAVTLLSVRNSVRASVPPPSARIAAAANTLGNATSLSAESITFTGYSEASDAWTALMLTAMASDTPEAAQAVFDAELPALDALRLAATTSRTVAPVFNPPGGTFGAPVTVHVSSPSPNAIIFFTLDGSEPTLASSVASAAGIPLAVDGATSVRAMALAPGLAVSTASRADFVIDLPDNVAVVASRADDSKATLVLAIVLPLVAVCCLVAGIVGYVVYRRKAVTYKLSSDSELVIAASDLSIGREVGHGSFGSVYAAEWRATPVAVKRMHGAVMTGKQLSEFVSEAETLLLLRHPNVLIFMGVTIEPPAIVTEFMERGSLYTVLHTPNIFIDPTMVFKWAHAMAAGLHFLEHAGIVHGDFKSLNVLINSNWTAKICDFGLSAARPALGTPAAVPPAGTRSGSGRNARRVAPDVEAAGSGGRIGTLYWSAPELLSGAGMPSSATDAYALGITLWEVATRMDVYAGANAVAVALDVVEGRRPDTKVVAQHFGDLVPIMTQLWAHDAVARMRLAAAAAELARLYSPDALCFPTTHTDPKGVVVCAHVVVPGFARRLASVASAERQASILIAFDDEMSEMTAAAGGVVVQRSVGRVTAVFHTDASGGAFLADLAGGEWSGRVACVVAKGDIGVERDGEGVRRLAGPVMTSVEQAWTAIFGGVASAESGLNTGSAEVERKAGTGVFASIELAAAFAAAHAGIAVDPISVHPSFTRLMATEPTTTPMLLSLVPGMHSSSNQSSTTSIETSGLGSADAPVLQLVTRSVMAALVADRPHILGSSSRVFATADPETGEPLVVKVLLKQDQTVASLAAVAVAAARSADAGAMGGALAIGPVAVCLEAPYVGLVFPRLTSGSLADVLRRSRADGAGMSGASLCSASNLSLSPDAALAVARDVAAAVLPMHSGRCHGSLKPANILLRANGSEVVGAVVTDACLGPIKSNQGTMTMVPTVAYMSPEALRGEVEGAAADVFVIASLLYELATGERAFEGTNALETGTRILSGWRPALRGSDTGAKLAPAVVELIEAAWAADPAERATMADVCRVLSEVSSLSG